MFAVLLAAGAMWGAEDAREIVRRSVEKDDANQKVARMYTFIERQDMRELDGNNSTKRREIKTFDITLQEGSPYRRLVARDDRPLSPEDERKEREKLDREIAQRQRETPEQRAKRVSDWEKKRQKEREFMREVPDAFDFTLLSEERAGDRDVWVIEALPRPGYRPHSLATRFLTKLKAKLRIAKADYAWVSAEAEVIDTLTVGAFLVRLHKGTRFSMDMTRVNGEVWLPAHVRLKGSARIALFKKVAADLDITYRDYRKFSAESRVVSFEPHPAEAPSDPAQR